uniref:Uncharacterized protein n=1 Tax=Moniliophthora roreri TaxID=221103 RepID=A0A0W0F257_MONRR
MLPFALLMHTRTFPGN